MDALLAPLSVIIRSDDTELRDAATSIRQDALANFRHCIVAPYNKHLEALAVVWDRLSLQIESHPHWFASRRNQASYRVLLKTRNQIAVHLAFFTQPNRAGERVRVGSRVLNRSQLARRVLERHDPALLKSSERSSLQDIVRSASAILQQRIDEIDAQLDALEASRCHSLAAVDAIMDHLRESLRRGYVKSTDVAAVQVEALLLQIFGAQPTWPVERRHAAETAQQRITDACADKGWMHAIELTRDAYQQAIQDGYATVFRQRKCTKLGWCAEKLIDRLDDWCQRRERDLEPTDPLARAILALHFCYSAAQNVPSTGGLDGARRGAYETRVARATRRDLRRAVKLLINSDLLPFDGFRVFRYHEAIWSAVIADGRTKPVGKSP